MNMRIKIKIASIAMLGFMCAAFVLTSILKEQQAFRAFERIARESPPLGIAGTDPGALKGSVRSLADTRLILAQAQKNPLDAWRVYSSLYPIRFLNALSDAEAARLVFIEEPTYLHYRTYRSALVRAVGAGTSDARRFSRALNVFSEDTTKPERFYSFAGAATVRSLQDASALLPNRFEEVSDTIRHGVPQVGGSSEEIGRISPQNLLAAKRIAAFLEGRAPNTDITPVRLETSACLRERPGPHYLHYFSSNGGPVRIHDVGELWFIPIMPSPSAPSHVFLASRDIQYIPYRPLNFYVCSEAQYDMGLVFALRFANEAYEDGTIEFTRSPKRDGYIDEQLVREQITDLQGRAAEELKLMLVERSARLDVLVNRIADQMRRSASQAGIPRDVQARMLFIEYSAFPSLFLLHNDHAGATEITVAVPDPVAQAKFSEFLVSFDDALKKRGAKALSRDTEALYWLDTE